MDSSAEPKADGNIKNKNLMKLQTYDKIIATGFGAGYWPWGPGTAGAAVGTLLWCCYALPLHSWGAASTLPSLPSLAYWYTQDVTILLIILFTLLSIRPIDRLETIWGPDPSRVVIDEVVGVWIALLAVPQSCQWYYVLAAFLLFRLFDIWKPFGIRWIDTHISGGLGVMFDDILAGVYAAAALYVLSWLNS